VLNDVRRLGQNKHFCRNPHSIGGTRNAKQSFTLRDASDGAGQNCCGAYLAKAYGPEKLAEARQSFLKKGRNRFDGNIGVSDTCSA
jgi:hypothetical protein